MSVHEEYSKNSYPANKFVLKVVRGATGHLLCRIYWASNLRDNVCRMGLTRLGDEIGFDRSTISRGRKKLVGDGYIVKVKEANEKKNEPAHYLVTSKFFDLLPVAERNTPLHSATPPVAQCNTPPVAQCNQDIESLTNIETKKKATRKKQIGGDKDGGSDSCAIAPLFDVSKMKVVDIQSADAGPDLAPDDWNLQLELETKRKPKARVTVIKYLEARIQGIPHGEAVSGVKLSGDLFVAICEICVYNSKFLAPKMSKQVKLVLDMMTKRMEDTGKPILPEHVKGFLEFYKTQDWRGKAGEKLIPSLITELWEAYAIWVRDGKKPAPQKKTFANGTQKQVDAWKQKNQARATVAEGETDDNWG